MLETNFKKVIKIFIWIVIVIIIVLAYSQEEKKSNVISEYDFTKQELLEMEIEELKSENYDLEEKCSSLSGQLEELQSLYKDSEELIDMLREQLESYGIEPYEL